MAISKLSRPYPSAAHVTEEMCESSLFKSHKFPYEVADRSVCRRVPQHYVMTRAMSCDTLPLCWGWGVGGEMGVRACVCVCVCGVYVRVCVCVCVVRPFWRWMHDLQGLARQDTDWQRCSSHVYEYDYGFHQVDWTISRMADGGQNL